MIPSECAYCGKPSDHEQRSPTNHLFGILTCGHCYRLYRINNAYAVRQPCTLPAERVPGDMEANFNVLRSNGDVDGDWKRATTLNAGDRDVVCPASVWKTPDGIIFFCMCKGDMTMYKGVPLKGLADLNPHFRPPLDLTADAEVMSPNDISAWKKAWTDSFPSATNVLQMWWTPTWSDGRKPSPKRRELVRCLLTLAVRHRANGLTHRKDTGHLPQFMSADMWTLVLGFLQHDVPML